MDWYAKQVLRGILQTQVHFGSSSPAQVIHGATVQAPSSGRFYIRRKVPADLRTAPAREFKRSLGTLDPSGAKARFAAAWSHSEQALTLARAALNGEETLLRDDIQELAGQWFAAEVQKLDRSKEFATHSS